MTAIRAIAGLRRPSPPTSSRSPPATGKRPSACRIGSSASARKWRWQARPRSRLARQLVKTPKAWEKKPAFSSLEQPHDFRFRQRIEVQIEADDRRRCVDLCVELVGLYGEHCEEVTVWMVA